MEKMEEKREPRGEEKEEVKKGICVAMLGNVNAGKSTTMGVLLSGEADNGKGLKASQVCKHPHERLTKKTSDISLRDGVIEGRDISLCDLAGHMMYFKTTISGITTNYPDLVLLCIDKSIEKMTKEHLGLASRMNIPILILITKVDFRDKEQVDKTYEDIKRLVNAALHRKVYDIRSMGDVDVVLQSPSTIGVLKISNTTLQGHDRLRSYLQKYNTMFERMKIYSSLFTVTAIYYVKGVGLVLAGKNGKDEIKIGDKLFLLTTDGRTVRADVRSIHDDFRHNIQSLPPQERGCLAVRVLLEGKQKIYRGSVLSHREIHPVETFKADINLLSSARVTLNKGFTCIMNMNSMREAVKIIDVEGKEGLRMKRKVTFLFLRGPRYVEEGQHFFFREGGIVGEGFVSKNEIV